MQSVYLTVTEKYHTNISYKNNWSLHCTYLHSVGPTYTFVQLYTVGLLQ